MAEIEERIDIETSSTEVFRLCHDIAKRPDWDERIARIKMITPAPVRTGSLIQVDASRGGSVFSWEGEYVEYKYPFTARIRVLDAAPSSPFKAGSELWQVSSVGGATRVVLTWKYQPRNFFARVLDVLGRRAATRSAIRKSLANLKETAESG